MVLLVPMNEEQFAVWREAIVKHYAEDKVKAGSWSADRALELSEADHRKLLPDGLATRDHYLFSIQDDGAGKQVGVLWLAVKDWGAGPLAFVFDLEVFEEFRRRGFAREAMLAAEEEAKKLGLDTIALHVFGSNHGARALYDKLGYEVTDINMSKRLS